MRSPSSEPCLGGGPLIFLLLAAGCSCGDRERPAEDTGDAAETVATTATEAETDSEAEPVPCAHVHFTEVDVQWSLDAAAQDLAIADLDGDGLPELVVARDRQPLVVLRNQGRRGGVGSKSFDVPSAIEGRNPVSVAPTDWNDDGLPDLVAVGSRVILYENTGNLAFRQVNDDVRPEHSSERVAVADMNGDGREDIIVYGGRGMAIYPAPDENGVLGEPFSLELGALGLRRGAVDDLDGDGIPDLAVAGWGNDPFLLVAHGDGAGGFERITQHSASEDIQALEAIIVDVDADGVLDVVVVGHTNTGFGPTDYVNRKPLLVWMRGLGNGQLMETALLELPSGAAGWSVDGADLTGDGTSELVAVAVGYQLEGGDPIPGAYQLVAYRAPRLEVVAPGFIDAGTAWPHIRMHDVDLDGRVDLVSAAGGVSVRWGCPR